MHAAHHLLALTLALILLSASAWGGAEFRSASHRKLRRSSRDDRGQKPAAPKPEQLFALSSGVGVTHCNLPGIINGEHIQLHVWIRAYLDPQADQLPGSANQGTAGHGGAARPQLQVKGFGFIENVEGLPDKWKLHLEEHSGSAYEHAKNATVEMYIRPLRRHDDNNVSFTLDTSWSSKGVISLSGGFALQGISSSSVAAGVQFLVQGFSHLCNVVPSTWGQRSAGGLEQAGQTVMLISPFFDYTAVQVAALLAWHMTWHAKFRVDLYVVYATEGLQELVTVPLIQALVQAGRLKLVLWQDLALPDANSTSLAYARYGHQTIIYNHALLALHAADSVIMVADLDEYLVTPKPMTVKQVVSDCIPGQFVGAMRLERQNVYNPALLAQNQAELPLWTDLELGQARKLPSVRAHPLIHYSACTDCNSRGKLFKSLYRPMHVSSVHIHFGIPAPGAQGADGPGRCARWLHVANQARPRLLRGGNLTALSAKWMWPMKG